MKTLARVFFLLPPALVLLALLLLLLRPAWVLGPVANRLLEPAGYRVLELRGATLMPRRGTLASLTLASGDARYRLRDLEVNYRLGELWRERQVRELRIGRLEVSRPAAQPAQAVRTSLAELAAELRGLELPTISIGTLVWNDELQLRRVRFERQPDVLGAEFLWRDFDLRLAAQWRGDGELIATAQARRGGDEWLAARYRLALRGDAINWEGETQLRPALFTSLAALLSQVPAQDLPSGGLALSARGRVEEVLTAPTLPAFVLSLSAPQDEDISLSLPLDGGQLRLTLTAPLRLEGSLPNPSGPFSFNADPLGLAVDLDTPALAARGSLDLEQFQAHCSLSLQCNLDQRVRLQLKDARLAAYRAETLDIQAALKLDLGAGQPSLSLASGASARLNGLRPGQDASWRLNELSLRTSAPLQAGQEDPPAAAAGAASLALRLPAAQLSLGQLEHTLGSSSLELSLQDIELRQGQDLRASASFASTRLAAGLPGVQAANPALEGSVSLDGAGAALRGSVSLAGQPLLMLELDSGTDLARGSAQITLANHGFSERAPLSSLVSALPFEGDLVSGTVAGRAQLQWRVGAEGLQLQGPVMLNLRNLGGYYGNTYFVGLSTEVLARMESPTRIHASETLDASLATLGIGLPIENVQWRYRFDTADESITINSLGAQLLGGRLAVEEFNYKHGRQDNPLLLQIDGIELGAIAALADYRGLEVEGAISGRLPMSLSASTVRVGDGRIEADPPGGSIRYQPPDAPENPRPSMQLVYRALSNYQFDSLSADVDYEDNGDLLLALELRGVNPDMNEGRRVNLNVNLTDNIPTLLRSLQASQKISDALERHLQQRGASP